ncbi:MAG: hypothetical protein H6667_15790 [Ardenticatenaceae bacterium]|nr:hypothetical protein [Ardenticatenaceae bacterium]MCB9443719.1 hypothetical protein [Ardenticatenaceae bacterium]
MAGILQAVRRYGPKLRRYRTAQLDDVVEWMAARTGLNRGEVLLMLSELHEAILFFNQQGQSVKLPDIGTFSGGIDRTGSLRLNFRADAALKRAFGWQHEYDGEILNKSRIGWTDAQYRELWDAENPDDPLVI